MTPFISFYTPTFRRPQHLAACLASVGAQTVANDIEQIVIPDHVGLGIGGMFQRVQEYASAVHGRYVHILADDDLLASPSVVEKVRAFAESRNFPPVILVKVEKAGAQLPYGEPWPPRLTAIDLGCVITRSDIWRKHAKFYEPIYEGDFTFMKAVHESGHQAAFLDLLFLRGAVSNGRAEVA